MRGCVIATLTAVLAAPFSFAFSSSFSTCVSKYSSPRADWPPSELWWHAWRCQAKPLNDHDTVEC